jgi:acyl-CoA reductase-like NAD-dependent aldehyde dehydrogenase
LTFRTPDEAVEKANNTPYGLSAGVWTEKGSRILWMADHLDAGVVWANTFNRFDPTSPFGGFKESGFGREGGRQGLEPYVRLAAPEPHESSAEPASDATPAIPSQEGAAPEVRKTYKLFIGGKFTRSESGRSYEVTDPRGSFLANAVLSSRKDVRDAVVAARAAWPGWKSATAYNRGQVLYRIAEMLESRRSELEMEVRWAEGDGAEQVEKAIDCFVYYAGWADKLAQVAGNLNPVAGPYFNITSHEPSGVAGIVAPEDASLTGLVERLAPALCAGDSTVVLASESHPLPAVVLGECLATADVPAGIVNVLTGRKDELVPVLASHLDVDVIDVTGVDEALLLDAERSAAGNVKRIVRSGPRGPEAVTAFMDLKTVWHPKGA